MKVVVIGANGVIGRAIAAILAEDHDVIGASRSTSEEVVDITSKTSLEQLFAKVAPINAVICAAGSARFAPLTQLTDDDFQFSLANKLMGQVNVVRVGTPYLLDGGSLTLTTGLLSRYPMPGSAAISLVNAGLEGFIRAAALELSCGIRLNGVSPGWVSETLSAMGHDPAMGVPAEVVAMAYIESLASSRNGEIIEPRS